MKIPKLPHLSKPSVMYFCGNGDTTAGRAAQGCRDLAGDAVDLSGGVGASWFLLSPTRGVGKSAALGVLVVGALLLGACASTRAPTANEQTHVAQVEIIQPNTADMAAFAVILKEAVIREAALYGDAGRPIRLRIELTRLHFKNPLKALTVGDDNQVTGQVVVVDPSTGQLSSSFKVRANAEHGGVSGSAIALTVVGIADPTGIVSMGDAVASAMSADLNRRGTETAMSANFAAETLRQTYGDARAKTAAKSRRAREKVQRAGNETNVRHPLNR